MQKGKIKSCPNCNTMLTKYDKFCSECGQKQDENPHTLYRLWQDFIGTLFNFDSKIWNTIITFFTKSGKVSLDYVKGKKIRYVPPIRLYLFVSFVYFLLLNYSSNLILESDLLVDFYKKKSNIDRSKKLSIDSSTYHMYKNSNPTALAQVLDSLMVNMPPNRKVSEYKFYNKEAIDSIQLKTNLIKDSLTFDGIHLDNNITKEDSKSKYYLKYWVNLQFDSIEFEGHKISHLQLKEMTNDPMLIDSFLDKIRTDEGYLEINAIKNMIIMQGTLYYGAPIQRRQYLTGRVLTFLNYTSYIMFLIMPLVAFLLKLFFYKKKILYYDHFIFTINRHSFLLLISSISILVLLLVNRFFDDYQSFQNIFLISVLALNFIYFVFAIKRFYAVSAIKSIMLSIPLVLIYSFILFSLTTAITVFLLISL